MKTGYAEVDSYIVYIRKWTERFGAVPGGMTRAAEMLDGYAANLRQGRAMLQLSASHTEAFMCAEAAYKAAAEVCRCVASGAGMSVAVSMGPKVA